MSKDFITKETDKLFSSNAEEFSKDAALAASWITAHFKGTHLKIYESKNHNSLADYFVVGSVENKVQAKSIANEIVRVLKTKNLSLRSLEGMDEGEWILIDLADVVIHIFQESSRDIYDVDALWMTYPQVQVPNTFYHSAHDTEVTATKNYSNYF